MVELLIAKEADINAVNSFGKTPLHFAAQWGRADVVTALLNRGAEPSRQCRFTASGCRSRRPF